MFCDAERIVGLISAQSPELQPPGQNLELKRALPPTGSIPARAGNHRPFSRQSVSTGSIPQTRGDNAFWNAQRAQAGMTMGNNPNQAARIGEIGVLWTALRLEQMIGQVDAVENDVQSHGNMPGLHAPPQ